MNGKVPIGECKASVVYMSGYLPRAAPEKSPILSPVPVRLLEAVHGGDLWKDVCGGGCGFAMAISDNGKLITRGSSDDEGQGYVASGKHGETPEPFPLPTEDPVIQASAEWARCAVVTEGGEAFTWGWKECIPSKDIGGKQQSGSREQVSLSVGEEPVKRRRGSTAKDETEGLTFGEDFFATTPSLVSVGLGVRIASVATGGRHTLALSGEVA